jgi:hypothetical protein
LSLGPKASDKSVAPMPSFSEKLLHLRFELEEMTRAESDWERACVLAKATTVLADFCTSFVGGYDDRLDELWRVARRNLGRAALVVAKRSDPDAPPEVEGLFETLRARAHAMRRMGESVSGMVDCLLVMLATESVGLGAPAPSDASAFQAARRRALGRLKNTKRLDDRALVRACFLAIGYERRLGQNVSAADDPRFPPPRARGGSVPAVEALGIPRGERRKSEQKSASRRRTSKLRRS